jgi:co-chaperonin GroES (HSP10)
MIKPILHRILVKPDNIEDKDEAFNAAKRMGLEIVKGEKDREQAAIDTGTVISFGETVFRDFGVEASPIKVGDTVVYARYAGKVIEDPEDKVKYVALNDEDVIAILTTEGA